MPQILTCSHCDYSEPMVKAPHRAGYLKPEGWLAVNLTPCGFPRGKSHLIRETHHLCPKCRDRLYLFVSGLEEDYL